MSDEHCSVKYCSKSIIFYKFKKHTFCRYRKKSPDNGLNGSVEDYGGSSSSSASNTSNILRPSPTPTRKTPSPTASPRGSPKLGNRNEAHHVKSPSQSSISVNAEKSDNAEVSLMLCGS